jgi:hypothetical protein
MPNRVLASTPFAMVLVATLFISFPLTAVVSFRVQAVEQTVESTNKSFEASLSSANWTTTPTPTVTPQQTPMPTHPATPTVTPSAAFALLSNFSPNKRLYLSLIANAPPNPTATATLFSTAVPTPPPTSTPANQPPNVPVPFLTSKSTVFQHDNQGQVVGAVTTISILTPVTDPDGDPISYAWSVSNGNISGNGLVGSWTRLVTGGQVQAGTVTVAASDGHGNTVTINFDVL